MISDAKVFLFPMKPRGFSRTVWGGPPGPRATRRSLSSGFPGKQAFSALFAAVTLVAVSQAQTPAELMKDPSVRAALEARGATSRRPSNSR